MTLYSAGPKCHSIGYTAGAAVIASACAVVQNMISVSSDWITFASRDVGMGLGSFRSFDSSKT
jgi:hypothetical protein